MRLYLTDLEAVRTETRTETGAGLYRPVYQPATLARRLAAIAAAHRDTGHPSPTRDPAVTAVLTGIRRARAHPPAAADAPPAPRRHPHPAHRDGLFPAAGRNAGTCPPCAALRWLRLLDAAAHGRPALMRAVLATPPGPEQDHLYPIPTTPIPTTPLRARTPRSGRASWVLGRRTAWPAGRRWRAAAVLLPAIDRDAYDHPRD